MNKEGTGYVPSSRSKPYGTQQASRLAWLAHYGRKPEKGLQLIRACGNPKCINPLHLRAMSPADMWRDPDITVERFGSVGDFKIGKHLVPARIVYSRQTWPPPADPTEGITDQHRFDPLPIEVIRAIRRCPIRATRSVLPCGFVRYDLPPGITEIAYTKPPESFSRFSLVDDEEEAPESAPKAVWALAA